jgi:hypothetical protein
LRCHGPSKRPLYQWLPESDRFGAGIAAFGEADGSIYLQGSIKFLSQGGVQAAKYYVEIRDRRRVWNSRTAQDFPACVHGFHESLVGRTRSGNVIEVRHARSIAAGHANVYNSRRWQDFLQNG